MTEDIYPLGFGTREAVFFQLTGISYPDPTYRIERLRSGVSCIEYIRRGGGTVISDGNTYTVSAGDVYYLEEGHDQIYCADPDEPWEKIWVNFSGTLARRMTECYRIGGQTLFRSLPIEDCLLRILALGRSPGEERESEASLALHEIFLRMSRHSSPLLRDERAVALAAYLDRHLTAPVRIEELARFIGVSPSTANRIFRTAYGVTPYAYLTSRRIEAAKALLLSTTLPIRSIALQLAYADEFYFSTVFKTQVGVSPSVFRRRR